MPPAMRLAVQQVGRTLASAVSRKGVVDKFTARYERQADHLWRARVVEDPEIFAAARTLARAREELRTLLLGRHALELTDDVVDDVLMSPECHAVVRRAVEAREAAATASDLALELARQAARALVDDGFSYRDAATVMGLSHTRVQQLVERGDS